MKKHGPDFYDETEVFETYSKHRASPDSANDTIEQPILWEMIGDPEGLDVLDLGCGDARIARKFRRLGARSYTGVEGSQKMFNHAKTNLEEGYSKVIHSWLEEYTPGNETFDLAVSSLALHYISDLDELMAKLARGLKPGGRLIFSVEHPVITSCNDALKDSSLRQAWIVDRYFERGSRNIQWMGDTVTIYHRTIEDFLKSLTQAGFRFKALRESDPPRDEFVDEELWKRRRRIPLFLFLEATK